MKKIITFFLFFCCYALSYGQSLKDIIISSTSFSQEFEALSSTSEIITSEDIQVLGFENLPELLNYASGVFVNRVNGATAEYYFRGFLPELRMSPIVFIDGMEISENFYNRTYLYNIPVTIEDIDRIEIIKDSSAFSNGYIVPGGIINIVTKKPQNLDNNYVSSTIGSNQLKNYNLSINKYISSAYWKLTGKYRGNNDYSKNRRIDKLKMVNLSVDKYFNKSKLFLKGSISENDLLFYETYPVGIFHKEVPISLNEKMNNLKLKNFLINYKYPNIDTSFYYQCFSGFVDINFTKGESNSKTLNEFYKYSFRLSFNNILTGFEYRYYHTYVENLTSSYENIFSSFVSSQINMFKNFNFKFTLRDEIVKNNGNNLNYKFNIGYTSNDKSFNINLGYLKTTKPAPLFVKNTYWESIIPYKNFTIFTVLHNNHSIKQTKLYSTDLNISKKINDFTFKTTFFYNRITNIVNQLGFLNLKSFPKISLDIYSKNLMDFVIHGFEANVNFKFNKNKNKIFASYVLQQLKNKTFDSSGNYYIPQYKFTSGVLFNYPFVSGSIMTNYIPSIKARNGPKSDYIFSVSANINKKFLKNKFEISLHSENIFNDVHKEAYYGNNIKRLIYIKAKYKF